MHTEKLDPHLERLVKAGVSGIDIMHGQLKIDMLEAEAEYAQAQRSKKTTTTLTQWNPWSGNTGRATQTLLLECTK